MSIINKMLCSFALTTMLLVNPSFAADEATKLNDATAIKPPPSTATGQVLIQANMELELINQADRSEENLTDRTKWYVRYFSCPSRSLSSNEPIFTNDDARNVICNRTTMTRNSITMSPLGGNYGFRMTGQRCTFPLLIWVPGNLVNRGGGININLYGRTVYLTLSGTPWVQPSSTTRYFSGTMDTRASPFFLPMNDGAFLNKAVMSPVAGNIGENKLGYNLYEFQKCR